jgi:PAS domain S-box-containing protein
MDEKNTSDRSIQIILVFIFVVLAVALFSLLDSRSKYNQQQHLQLITERYELAYKTIYSQHKRLATSIYSGTMGRFEIEDLYEKLATVDEVQKNMLRKELAARIIPRYKVLQQTARLRQLHFHLSNNESFLRVHRPEKFGDNLKDIRRTVEYVNREHSAIDGFEEGRIYNCYRFIFPITARDKTHLGSMEISFGPEAFTSTMMEQHAVLSNFYVKGAIVEGRVFPDELDRTYKKSHHPGYYFDKNVLKELEKISRKEMKKLQPQKIVTDELYANAESGRAMSLYDSSSDMVFTTIPVINPLTQEMAAFFTVRSNSDFFVNEARQFKTIFYLCLFLMGMIFFTFYLQYSKRRVLESAMTLLQQERDMFMQGSVMTFSRQNSENWPVTQFSANVLDILGYSAKEFLDGSVSYGSLIHPDDLQRVMDEVRDNSGPECSGFTHEPYRLLNRDGESIWILDSTTLIRDSQGMVSHYSGYLVDISAFMLMKEEVVEANNRLELVIKGARLGTWDWNIQTGEVIFNERWADILGYSLEEMKPHISTWEKIIHPEEQDEVTRILNDHLEGRTSVYMTEHRLRHKTGKWVWVLDVGKVFERDEEGDPLRAVGIHLDISEQKEAALQLLGAKEAAESANQAKSAFLSNMSHELRTPLNAILGYTQIFAEDNSLTAQQQSGIKTMHQSGEHLLMLINDILDLSKIEADRMELVLTEFRLPEFIRGVADIIRGRAAKKEIGFFYEQGETLPVAIKADELRLRQVLLNLLSNAVKFTGHGQCTFRVTSQLLDGNRALLTMTVEDSGAGIAPEMLEKVFEPFQQTGDRLQYCEGSGLGLGISRKLVNLMGGELQLVSPINEHPAADEGPGSRFSFSVEVVVTDDVSSSDLEEHTATGNIVAGEEWNHKKILIVDDNASNRAVLRDILEPIGFITSEAEDGSEVLPACRRFQPDAILMDLRMPKMDGFAATEELKSHPDFAGIPVLGITASTAEQQKLRKRCLEYGFSCCITKPYSVADLLQALAEQLHLEFQYAKEVSGETISREEEGVAIPPQELLGELNRLLWIGDISGVVAQAEEITAMESGKYQSFARWIEQMAEEFRLTELEEFITMHKEV